MEDCSAELNPEDNPNTVPNAQFEQITFLK